MKMSLRQPLISPHQKSGTPAIIPPHNSLSPLPQLTFQGQIPRADGVRGLRGGGQGQLCARVQERGGGGALPHVPRREVRTSLKAKSEVL